jgi:hypothetical protein
LENDMTEDLILPVPHSVPAMYLVPAAMPGAAAERVARAAVATRIAEPLRSLTLRLLDGSVLLIAPRLSTQLPAMWPLRPAPDEMPADQARAARDAIDLVAFATLLPPSPGPVHEWTTRAAAAAFAAELGLPVVDGYLRRACTAPTALASLPGAPELAGVGGGFRLADWLLVQFDAHCLMTRGLGRFGLPELRIDQVPPELRPPWVLALTGLGHRLLELLRRALRRDGSSGGETAFVQVPAELPISRADIGLAYGCDLGDDVVLPVRLSLDPALTDQRDSYLTLDAPEDGGTVADHRRALGAALLGRPIAAAAGAQTPR